MQKIDNLSSFKASSHHLNERNWLELAEFASITGSALGSLAAAVSGQILYAAAPLTLALSLNLVNRQRYEVQMRESINSAIADVHTVVQDVHEQVQQALLTDDEDLDAILSDLQHKLRNLENTVLGQQDWETVNVRFLLLEEKLTAVKNITSDLQQTCQEKGHLQDLQASVDSLQNLASSPAIDLTAVETQLNHLQQRVTQLQQQNKDIVKPYLQRLTRAVKQLQKN